MMETDGKSVTVSLLLFCGLTTVVRSGGNSHGQIGRSTPGAWYGGGKCTLDFISIDATLHRVHVQLQSRGHFFKPDVRNRAVRCRRNWLEKFCVSMILATAVDRDVLPPTGLDVAHVSHDHWFSLLYQVS